MFSIGLLSWIGGHQEMAEMLSQNWLIGTIAIAAIIFCETGLVFLPFLPGDSMLFAAGAFLGASDISTVIPIGLITMAAVAGDGVNYMLGRSWMGQRLVTLGWIKPDHLAKSRAYFDRFGGVTVTIGRFVPVVRTMAPFLAGLSRMRPATFAFYNVLGALLWCGGLMTIGVWLGSEDWVRDHLLWLAISIVIVSAGLVLLQRIRRSGRTERKANARAVG